MPAAATMRTVRFSSGIISPATKKWSRDESAITLIDATANMAWRRLQLLHRRPKSIDDLKLTEIDVKTAQWYCQNGLWSYVTADVEKD